MLFIAGDQVPLMLFIEVVGKAANGAPEQIGVICVNVGIMLLELQFSAKLAVSYIWKGKEHVAAPTVFVVKLMGNNVVFPPEELIANN